MIEEYIYPIKTELDFSSTIIKFYDLVRNGGPLDLKQYDEWQSRYFIFDNAIYRGDAPGNIAYGIAGNSIGIQQSVLLRAAGYAQIQAGTSKEKWIEEFYGDDPYDQLCIMVGINFNNRRKNK